MEPEFQEEQFEQAAKSVPPDEMLSSKDLEEKRDGAQGDPRKRVLGCESKMCRLGQEQSRALEKPARSVVEHAQKIKAPQRLGKRA